MTHALGLVEVVDATSASPPPLAPSVLPLPSPLEPLAPVPPPVPLERPTLPPAPPSADVVAPPSSSAEPVGPVTPAGSPSPPAAAPPDTPSVGELALDPQPIN